MASWFKRRDKNKAAPSHTEEYIAADTEYYPVGGGADFVYSYNDGSLRLLPAHLSAILNQCNRFRSLKEHSSHLLNRGADARHGELYRRK
ncbi:hypothetical protein ES703_103354 [subsurface metagenome]